MAWAAWARSAAGKWLKGIAPLHSSSRVGIADGAV